MGGGGGSSDNTTKIRYAWYIEVHHQQLLNTAWAYTNSSINNSPFANFINIPLDAAFFGTGYLISSFPSLYDMYGKFMAGLDIETLWNQLHTDTAYGPVINDIVASDAALLEDELNVELTKMRVGMRDINSVMSSSFIVTEGNMRDTKLKVMAKTRSDLRAKFTDLGQRRWETHLEWNKGVVSMYTELMKLYYAAKMDIDDYNYSMATKNLLWPFTVLDQYRSCVGVLSGATTSSGGVKGASQGAKVLSGMASGAAMGAMAVPANPVVGAIVGGVIGGIAGALS